MNKNNLLISVIVPVYNVEEHLEKCLDSILSQSYQNIEVILVNDGSSDDSGEICDEYAAKSSIFVVVHKKNEGVAKARLTGFEISSGDYITFVDGDDYITSNYIEKLVNPIIKYQVDLVCCKHFDQYGDLIIPSKYTTKGLFKKSDITSFISSRYIYDDILGHSGIPIFLVTKLIKREFVSKGLLAGKGLWWGEDQIAAFQIIMDVNSMFILNECLYYYVKHEGQATSVYKTSLWKNQLDTYMRYKTIDKDNLLKLQLIKHVWKYSFLVNLYKKMPKEIHSFPAFSNELKRIDKQEGWKVFFKGKTTGLGWKNDVKFWLIKLRQYRLLYFLCFRKNYEQQ